MIKNKFEVIITGVFAYPLDRSWLGRKIDAEFIQEMKRLQKKYQIHSAGEGGEFESFVLHCPLFSRRLKLNSFNDYGSENAWRREIRVE